MASIEAAQLGARLDEHHSPETNGRMAVCRRCGARTDGLAGRKHTPNERQLARYNDWLVAQSLKAHIERSRRAGGR
ncbi:MAG: hypothetical protein ACYCV7_06755 [Acidimicrobiales bacterium]